ncbi:hypothetical protein [Turneriella parva]|uniref:Peptidase S54 rhomboid domain-containing protein n=1 Tax=Turneriella parva (strain ATCC BAA-1111 / DSM 21527 / NCTC 11395 / H) TaxID=869212 RepID=I4B362_TURPD|nr:hypothetical protein [Turneriella parva]AFM11719.1 hypothetical protein Turpa_1070 [Turneriella parva DSM 21527]
MSIQTPRFIDNLERKYYRFGIENLGLILVVMQAFGFFAYQISPLAKMKFMLIPELVMRGEIWRVITFIALPLSNDFWIIIVLFFIYSIMQIMEQAWGPFKTTLYFLIGLIMSVGYSLATGLAIDTFMPLEMSLFFAVAALYPRNEVLLFFFIPVPLWILAVFQALIIVYLMLVSNWIQRGYYAVVYLNYFLFFGLHHYGQYRAWSRRRNWQG